MPSLRALAEHGQSPWVDYLSRPMLRDGELGDMIDSGITGVTSNPTTFAKAITEGDAYDDRLAEQLGGETDPKQVFLALAKHDIRDACDLLRPTFDSSGGSCDGWVSLEVDPRLADDTEATVREAHELHRLIDRPNLFVKIPGTPAGLPAIEETIAAGIPVNVTLLFGLERHRAAAEAYLRGLRRLHEAGGDLTSVASVASFFVSRVDAEADRRLEALESKDGAPGGLSGTLAVANAKLAYRTYRDVFSGPEWTELAEHGARPQQCLWASTAPKDPELPDVYYVQQLIGPETVCTMPPETVRAFADHGVAVRTLGDGVEESLRTLERFAEAGINYDDLTDALERDGVDKFAASFRELFDGIDRKLDQLAERSHR